jgi:hypothetical protein
MIVNNPNEVLLSHNDDPSRYGGIRSMEGGWFAYLIKTFGEPAKGFKCGSTFKLQHKGVTLFDRFFQFPFELSEFEEYYKQCSLDNPSE